jgi:DNA invertase Pin-like site-specific DNA recombinase
MKAALYARVSTDRQEVENQLRELRQFCKPREWEVYAEYVDENVRGKEEHKPALEKLLLDAHHGKFKVVVFWALDRISREGVKDTIDLIYRFQELGLDWVSHQEMYLSTLGPFRDAVISLFATLAKMGSERKGERIKASFSRLKEIHKDTGEWKTRSGKPPNRPRRDYGYQAAQIVELRAQGLSWSEITTRTQIPPSSARRLAKSVVSASRTATHSRQPVSEVSNG